MEQQFIRQTTFNTGQVDIQNWKRTDVKEYLTAAQALLNMEVGTTGLAKKRKGTSLLLNVTAYAQFNSKMYDFVDNFGVHYVVLSAAGFMYVFSTPDNEAQVITNTNADVVTGYGTNVVVNSSGLIFVQPVPVPYQTGDLDDIDYTQDNDAIIFTHPDYPPARLYISKYNTSAPPTFSYQVLNIYPLPAYDFNTINYNNFTVALSVTGNVLTFQFTGIGANPGFNSAWIGGQIIGGGASETQLIGYAIITAVSYSASGGGTVTFTATVQIPFNTTTSATVGSQYSVRQPAWSAALGYPAKVLYFQNRLWFGNTASLSNTIFGSKINQPINFDVGTGVDTDAIIYTIGQTNSGSILWMNGGKQMEVYCQYYEFACPQTEGSGLTPSTFSIRQQSSYGASSILKPITYINDSYFSSKAGNALINFHFNGIGLTYVSSSISVASSSLAKNPSNRAILRGTDSSQDNFIYFLNPDNTLTSFQFATEYKLAALTPVVFEENVDIIDICTIDNTVYILKFYALTEQYIIEAFDDNQRIDCAQTVSISSGGVITGLSLFNGYTVQVVYQGNDLGEYLVVGGQITVTNPPGFAASVTVGLLYENNCIPMYPYSGAVESAFKKQVTRVYVDYYNAINFQINGVTVPYQTFKEIQQSILWEPLVPQNGTEIFSPVQGWNRFDNNGVPIISITQRSPFDLQILGIGYQIESAIL